MVSDIQSSRELFESASEMRRRYEFIVNTSKDFMTFINRDYEYEAVNQSYCDAHQKKREEIIGKTVSDVWGNEVFVTIIKAYLDECFDGHEVHYHAWFDVANLGRRYFDVTYYPYITKKESVTHAVVVSRDTTEHKRAEEQIKLFSHAIERSFDGINITDLKGNIIYSNEASAQMYGYRRDEMIGQHVNTLKAESGVLSKEIISAIQERGGWKGELEQKRKDGSQFPVSLTSSLINDETGNPIGMLEIVRDITQQKKIERAKDEFVSFAAHQLITPLSTVKWYVETLQAHVPYAAGPRFRQYLDEVYQSNQRMIDMVNTFLSVSRIELGTFGVRSELVDLPEIIESVIHDFKSLITQKRILIKTTFDEDVSAMYADRLHIRMIVQNLISNALKYTPEDGIVQITITSPSQKMVCQTVENQSESVQDYVLLKISDTGCGIPTHQHSDVFSKFFRGDNAQTISSDGSGLGLYIIKGVVDAYHGRVWFESAEDQGTTFYALFPLNKSKNSE